MSEPIDFEYICDDVINFGYLCNKGIPILKSKVYYKDYLDMVIIIFFPYIDKKMNFFYKRNAQKLYPKTKQKHFRFFSNLHYFVLFISSTKL